MNFKSQRHFWFLFDSYFGQKKTYLLWPLMSSTISSAKTEEDVRKNLIGWLNIQIAYNHSLGLRRPMGLGFLFSLLGPNISNKHKTRYCINNSTYFFFTTCVTRISCFKLEYVLLPLESINFYIKTSKKNVRGDVVTAVWLNINSNQVSIYIHVSHAIAFLSNEQLTHWHVRLFVAFFFF